MLPLALLLALHCHCEVLPLPPNARVPRFTSGVGPTWREGWIQVKNGVMVHCWCDSTREERAP